jgi:hypothetical protein
VLSMAERGDDRYAGSPESCPAPPALAAAPGVSAESEVLPSWVALVMVVAPMRDPPAANTIGHCRRTHTQHRVRATSDVLADDDMQTSATRGEEV